MEENPDSKATTAPPPQDEPELKRPKMSTTTSDDESTPAGDGSAKKQRFKRRKIAIFFAYCGVGYQGMQKNPGAKTIEGDLEEALFHAGAVPEQDRGCPKRYDWARSARTDKGVSAVGQVVSGRFYIDPPGLVERLNSILPQQFRIFGYKRVTASFNSKKFCDRRRYVYLIPVFALDPSSHPDRESVMASLGSGNELAKCFECSERGRKVIGAVGKRSFESKSVDTLSGISDAKVQPETGEMSDAVEEANVLQKENGGIESAFPPSSTISDAVGKRSFESKSVDSLSGISWNTRDVTVQSETNQIPDPVEEVKVAQKENGETESAIPPCTTSDGKEVTNEEEKVSKGSEFVYGEEQKERFNRILNYYVGSHNFHNFTTRTKAEDPAARRYIISFDAKTTVTVEGIEFVKCEVVGQSFMLHQIRKMIGLAVAVMRNCAPEKLMPYALQKDVNINVPTAPEVGLYLDECFFTSYNKKWKDHEELSMKDYEEEAEDFKMKYIYSHIASTEHKEGAVALWLHSLNHRNYPDLKFDSQRDGNGEKSAQVELHIGNNGDGNEDAHGNGEKGDENGKRSANVENIAEEV